MKGASQVVCDFDLQRGADMGPEQGHMKSYGTDEGGNLKWGPEGLRGEERSENRRDAVPPSGWDSGSSSKSAFAGLRDSHLCGVSWVYECAKADAVFSTSPHETLSSSKN